jgi:hypothetical protein
MRLPRADETIISPEKLHAYLLSPEHPIGRFKAAFFEGLGYRMEDWATLEADLRSQLLTLDAKEEKQSRYGRKFIISGALTGPAGRTADMVTVWVI